MLDLVRCSMALVVLATLAGCPTSDATTDAGGGDGFGEPMVGTCASPIPRALTPQPGIQQGFVVDRCGTPLDGVRVLTRNAFANATDAPLTARTNLGFYTQTIPSASVWETWAEIDRDFDGDAYCIEVIPEVPDSFAAKDGAVRNMVWRLDGERPDSAPGNRHFNGGGLIVDANRILNANIAGTLDSVLTFIFRPIGPLVDGSTPADFVRQIPFGELGDYSAASTNGFPLGKYELIVAITFPSDPTNYQVYTRINTLPQPFTSSVIAKFSDSHLGNGDISCLTTPRLNLELSLTAGS